MFMAGFARRNSDHMAEAIFDGEDMTPLGTNPEPISQIRKKAISGSAACASRFMNFTKAPPSFAHLRKSIIREFPSEMSLTFTESG
jgi:hypothetical protein